MARTKYQSEKRRKELAKKKRKEEKRQRKLDNTDTAPKDDGFQPREEGENE